jgi:predicted PurR-regulated permease PerM
MGDMLAKYTIFGVYAAIAAVFLYYVIVHPIREYNRERGYSWTAWFREASEDVTGLLSALKRLALSIIFLVGIIVVLLFLLREVIRFLMS